jgi:LuxR family maltose regulon positive regulatory protein
MYLLGGVYHQISPYFEQLQKIFENPQTASQLGEAYPSLKAEWLVLRSLMYYRESKMTECMDIATRALEIAPEQDNRVRSLAYYSQASVCWNQEDYVRAIELFQLSIQYGRAADNLVAETMSTVGLAGMVLELGQLHLAFEITSQAVTRIERVGVLTPISAVVYASRGDAHYQWYQIEEARSCFQRALHLSALGGANTTSIMCHVLLSRTFQIEGNLETAIEEVQKAADLLPAEVPDYISREVTVQQVHLYQAQNRIAAAQMVLLKWGFSFQEKFSFPVLLEDNRISYSVGLLYNSSLRILVSQTKGDPSNLRTGLKLADDVITRAFQSQQLLIRLEALLLRAQIHAKLGDHPKSRADYIQALELAEPEGFISIFVEQNPTVASALANLTQQNLLRNTKLDYVERILAAFSQSHKFSDLVSPTKAEPVALVEPLSERELDVLRLMAEGLKYKEVADQLCISLNTVRSHTKAIYGKLSVSNRTQAIEKARQFQIL